jgi:hypothetical protein
MVEARNKGPGVRAPEALTITTVARKSIVSNAACKASYYRIINLLTLPSVIPS